MQLEPSACSTWRQAASVGDATGVADATAVAVGATEGADAAGGVAHPAIRVIAMAMPAARHLDIDIETDLLRWLMDASC
jgi:hypothetical protein